MTPILSNFGAEAGRFWAGLSLARPLVMGIINVTPDSFSDKGQLFSPEAAIVQGQAMLRAGADIIDIGGESTRPGAAPVAQDEEAERVLPVIRALAATGVVVSVDTRNARTMASALDQGAQIVNDISALCHDPDSARIVARHGCGVILMHMRGTPQTMARHAEYADLVPEVMGELTATRDAALAAGIAPQAIALDPGFGFAKTAAQNVVLLRQLDRLVELGHPLVVGVSRKRFIGQLSNQHDPAHRDPGSIAAGLYAVSHGMAILRVHDVAGTVQALRVWNALVAPSLFV